VCDPDDFAGLGAAIVRLDRSKHVRDDLSFRGLENARRYGREAMIERFVSLYRQLAAA